MRVPTALRKIAVTYDFETITVNNVFMQAVNAFMQAVNAFMQAVNPFLWAAQSLH